MRGVRITWVMRTVAAWVVGVMIFTGCVADEPEDEVEPIGGVATPAPPMLGVPEVPAACFVRVETFRFSTSATAEPTCTARIEVVFDCHVGRQAHTWARLGVTVEGEVWAVEDTDYACGATVSRTFEVPCEAAISGGATFDHPQTGEDVSCEVPVVSSALST